MENLNTVIVGLGILAFVLGLIRTFVVRQSGEASRFVIAGYEISLPLSPLLLVLGAIMVFWPVIQQRITPGTDPKDARIKALETELATLRQGRQVRLSGEIGGENFPVFVYALTEDETVFEAGEFFLDLQLANNRRSLRLLFQTVDGQFLPQRVALDPERNEIQLPPVRFQTPQIPQLISEVR